MVEVDSGQSAATVGDGTYSIAGVPAGVRTVTVSATGFAAQDTNATVGEDQTTTVDFALDPEDPGTDPPGPASMPFPTGFGASIDSILSWVAGSGADSHDVYFGTALTPGPGEFQGNQSGTTFDPGPLDVFTSYFWRIDEVNAGGTTTGEVWSFRTAQSFNLSANGYKVQGRQRVDLTWSGHTSNVDIYRDGMPLIQNVSGASYTDIIGARGGGTYEYQVCETGTSVCTNIVTVVF
jgi:hypothetical protein